MSLTAHEKAALESQIEILIDADEPEAVLATLHRVAERMTVRAIWRDQHKAADRWMKLAKALDTLLKNA